MSHKGVPIDIFDSDEEQPTKRFKPPAAVIDLTSEGEDGEDDEPMPALDKRPIAEKPSAAPSRTLWPGAKGMADRRTNSNHSSSSVSTPKGKTSVDLRSPQQGSPPVPVKFSPPSPNNLNHQVQRLNKLQSESAAKPNNQIPPPAFGRPRISDGLIKAPLNNLSGSGTPKTTSPKHNTPQESTLKAGGQAPSIQTQDGAHLQHSKPSQPALHKKLPLIAQKNLNGESSKSQSTKPRDEVVAQKPRETQPPKLIQPDSLEKLNSRQIFQNSLTGESSKSQSQKPPTVVDKSRNEVVGQRLQEGKAPTSVPPPKVRVIEPLAMSASEKSAVSSPPKRNTTPTIATHIANPRASSSKDLEDPISEQEDTPRQSLSSESMATRVTQEKASIGNVLGRHSHRVSTKGHKSTVEEIESILRQNHDDLKDEVALATRTLLEEAKDTYRKAPKNFTDKLSPWKSVGALPHSTGSVPAKTVSIKIDTMTSNKTSAHKSKSSRSIVLIGTTFKDSLPKVPNYTAITFAKRNILTADDEVLKSVPYLGQTDAEHQKFVKELETHYTNVKLINIEEAERAGQISGYLDSWLANIPSLSLTEEILQRHILQQGYAQKTSNISRLVLNSLGGGLSNEISKTAADFDKAFRSVFELELSDVVLPDSHLKGLIKKLKPAAEPVPSGQSVFSNFAEFLCLVCGLAYCQMHGDYNSNPVHHLGAHGSDSGEDEYEYHYQPLASNYTDLVRKHELRISNKEQDDKFSSSQDMVACSKACYLSDDVDDVYEPWSREMLNTMKEYIRIFTNPDDQACKVSLALNIPCWQVNREIRKCAKRHNRIPKRLAAVSDRLPWYNNEKKTLSSRWEDMTDVHNHEKRSQLNPCAHEGPCNSNDCSCFRDKVLCERMCGCSGSCGRRFTGCNCVPDVHDMCCTSDTCICLQMNRECGPECISCCALDRIDPKNQDNDDLFTTGCQNIAMQRGVPKRLLIGESTLVGFGAYIAEPAKKGDYLGPYVGEVISFEESERRAIIYERKDCSFLFDLNGEWTIDGAKQGNKTRFINHASTPQTGQNCSAKVLFVNGEQRIKFLALRDIKAGEELLFNYGDKFAEAHFKKALGNTKGKDKKSVLTGDDLDLLDGLKLESKNSRKNISASRGDHGSGRRGRGKARKTATKETEVMPEEVEDPVNSSFDPGAEVEDSDEDDEDDDVEDEEAENGRPRRRIRRPARYTR